MQRDVINVNKCVKSYKSKIVYSTVVNNGLSVNWKADWARFRGKTYAQVLKSNTDSCCRSRVQPSYKLKIIRSGERYFKNVNSNTVASVNLPVHAKNEQSLSVKMNKR